MTRAAMWIVWSLLLAIASVSNVGCGGSSVSERSVLDARSSVRAAQEVGARQSPQAAYHLELANEELSRADNLIRDGEGEAADRMLQRAKVDAELAIALAREAQTAARANETRHQIDQLRQQNF